MVKLLVIKNSYNDHLVRFLTHLKMEMPDAVIDFLAPEEAGEPPVSIVNIVRHFYTFDDLPKGRILNYFFLRYRLHNISSLRKVAESISKENHYDSITIHYPMWHYLSIMQILRKSADKIIVFPWGSDVYRASWYEKIFLSQLYKRADYVGSQDNRFRKDFCRILKVDKSKLQDLNIGSDMVDYIHDNLSSLSKGQAKERLGVKGKYVITCGYNNQISQQHSEIIDAIYSIKDKLPKDFILFFPVTYGGTKKYTSDLENKVIRLGLNAMFFKNYLTEPDYFILMRASDMFIHIQTTDADSGSVKEFILSGAKVINGSWLKYDDLLKYEPKPYFEVDSINSLGPVIANVIDSKPIDINPKTTELLYEFGWKYAIKVWKRFYESTIKN